METLSPTGKVLLGLLRNRARSGYDLKAAIDKSTRFFWAASYGQIYPELRKLEEAGLVRADDASRGGRRRTVYAITGDGEAALRHWLTGPEETSHEMRDEGLLKFFFAAALSPEEALEVVAAKRRVHEGRLGALRAIEAEFEDSEGFAYRTLQHGIGLHEHVIEWCREQERELSGAHA